MRRSQINAAIREAMAAFDRHHWALPPNPRWDVTDFGLGDFNRYGLTLVNLAEQPEYCEKVMFVRRGQTTPCHHHKCKKEDIICRWGLLAVQIHTQGVACMRLQVNGVLRDIAAGEPLLLRAGERITLTQGIDHSFWAESQYAIIGEVSTANDDLHDNYFENAAVGRFSAIEEDEPPLVRLVSD